MGGDVRVLRLACAQWNILNVSHSANSLHVLKANKLTWNVVG